MLFNKLHDKIIDELNSITIKHPKYIASTTCWIYLTYHKDFDITATKFVNLIHLRKDIRFTKSKSLTKDIPITNPKLLSKTKNDFIQKIFELDLNAYRSKVETYVERYVNKMKLWFMHSIPNKELLKDVSKSLDQKFVKESLELFDKAIENGFQINHFANTNKLYYYFPQVMALSLIFYISRRDATLQGILNGKFFEKVFKPDPSLRYFRRSFRYITEKENRLYPFIMKEIGHIKDKFIQKSHLRKN